MLASVRLVPRARATVGLTASYADSEPVLAQRALRRRVDHKDAAEGVRAGCEVGQEFLELEQKHVVADDASPAHFPVLNSRAGSRPHGGICQSNDLSAVQFDSPVGASAVEHPIAC